MKRRLSWSLKRLLIQQFIDFWPYYIGAMVCLIATHWIQSRLPFLAKELMELAQEGAESMSTTQLFLLALGIVIFRSSSRLLFFYPARLLQKYLRVELLDRLEMVSPSRYQKHSDGQLFQVMSMDMDQIRSLVGFALMHIGNILIAFIVLIPQLASANTRFILALTPLLIAFILFTIIVNRNRGLYRKTQDLQGDVQNIVLETYSGKKTIKNFQAEETFIDWFRDYSWRELSSFYKAGIGVGISIPLMALGIGLSLVWGAYIVKVEGLGVSTLVLFSGFVFLFWEPMMFLSWIGVVFSRSIGSWERIKELVGDLELPSEQESWLLEHNDIVRKEGELCFVTEFWSEKLDFNIKELRWSVLIGKTGVGKSHLLSQFADTLKLKGERISYVAQSPYLYNDSIEKNIFLGKEISEKERKDALFFLTLFGLDYIADNNEALLELEVGENGKLLSGGQAKRLCLVRSLMSGASVILWDDPFSSVDLILEKRIILELKELSFIKKKTIILTSHRLSTVRLSEHVIFLDQEKGILENKASIDALKKGHPTYEYFEGQMV